MLHTPMFAHTHVLVVIQAISVFILEGHGAWKQPDTTYLSHILAKTSWQRRNVIRKRATVDNRAHTGSNVCCNILWRASIKWTTIWTREPHNIPGWPEWKACASWGKNATEAKCAIVWDFTPLQPIKCHFFSHLSLPFSTPERNYLHAMHAGCLGISI